MAEVLFYHLEGTTVEQALPGLLSRSLQRGWRAIVRAGSLEACDAMDAHLWTYADDSFLPHGLSSPADQPVFLCHEDSLPEGFDVLFLIVGGVVETSAMTAFERVVIMFDEEGATDARTLWKEVTVHGYEATYWRQSPAGKWEKVQ